MEEGWRKPCRKKVGNNNKGGNIEAGDESNEREDVTGEIKGQRTGLMRG